MIDNGIKGRPLPTDFPPWSTAVYNYFVAWEAAAGLTLALLDGLRDRVRLHQGRAAAPSAAIIDSAWVVLRAIGQQSRTAVPTTVSAL